MAPHSTQIVIDKVATVFVFLIEQKSSIHSAECESSPGIASVLLYYPGQVTFLLGRNLLFCMRRLDKFPNVASH